MELNRDDLAALCEEMTKDQVDRVHRFLHEWGVGPEDSFPTQLSLLTLAQLKLYHPDRFANEPDKLATYENLTAAINRAKEAGDIQTLREIAEDPAGYILRQGWTGLDFSDEVELAELRRLHESLQLEIITVIESLEQLKESAEYELCGIVEQRPRVLDEVAAERVKLLETESAELQQEADKLADEIKELSGDGASRII